MSTTHLRKVIVHSDKVIEGCHLPGASLMMLVTGGVGILPVEVKA